MYIVGVNKNEVDKMKNETRKSLANQLFDLYAKKNNWKIEEGHNKKNWVKWLLEGRFSIGYKSFEELKEWRDRMVAEMA